MQRPYIYKDHDYYTPRNEVRGGGILESPCPSVCLSVCLSVRLSVDARLGKIVSSAYMLPLYTYPHETSHAISPWVKYGPYGLWGQKVKGQGHNARIARLGKMVSCA